MLFSLIFLALLSDCGQSSSKPEKPKDTKPDITKKEDVKWVEPKQIYDLYLNPDKYTGYHVKLTGVYDRSVGLVDRQKQFDFNMTMDPIHIEAIPTSTYVISDDLSLEDKFVSILDDPSKTQAVALEGVVEGTISDSEALDPFGRPSLKVKAKKVKIGEYLDLVSPTLETLELGQTKENSGYKVTIDKIEFSPIETRVYATITNNGSQALKVGSDAFNGKQGDKDIFWITSLTYKGYDSQRLPELVNPGQTVSGIALMDVIDYKKDWILKDNTIVSEDYKERLMFEINIPAIRE